MKPKLRAKRWLLWPLLAVLVVATGCSGGSPKASKTTDAATTPAGTSAATATPSNQPTSVPTAASGKAGLAPDPHGPTGHCLVGSKPWNIEFYGVDASSICARYSKVFGDLGYPNQPVHQYEPPGSSNFVELRPDGYSRACGYRWPLDVGNLELLVVGYSSGDLFGDPGPEAKKICTKIATFGGWVVVEKDF